MQSLAHGVQEAQMQRKGRWKMLIVLLVCAAPVVASYFTYYVIRPEGRRNFGELITPQRPMPSHLQVTTQQGQVVSLSQLQGQWLLISTSTADCDARCEQHLYLQRQLREGLGRDKDRLDWVWVVQDRQQPPARLQPALQQAQVLQMDATTLSQWLEPAKGQQLADHIYVVDPMGNWMLRFPAQLDASTAGKAKRDLERLLRASAGWDRAGR